MKGKQTLLLVLVLMVLTLVGSVGMLLVKGWGNLGFFFLMLLPLLTGLWCGWRQRRPAEHARRD